MADTTSSLFDNTQIAYNAWSEKRLRMAYRLLNLVRITTILKIAPRVLALMEKQKLPGVKWIERLIFNQYCGGSRLSACEQTINRLGIFKISTALDYAVENESEERQWENNVQEFIKINEKGKNNRFLNFCVIKISSFGSNEVLEKLSAKKELSEAEEKACSGIREKLNRICYAAWENDVGLFIDAEESRIQPAIHELAIEMMEKYNQDKAIVYNTYQMYLKNSIEWLKKSFRLATMKSFFLGVKLVRGAYLEKEKEWARKQGLSYPIHEDKATTDNAFNEAIAYCLNNKQRVFLCCATHNEYSNHFLTVGMDRHGLKRNDPRVIFMQLYGMADHITYNLANLGYNTGKYIPYGPVEKLIPYLVRRVQENQIVLSNTTRELLLIKQEILRRQKLKQAN